MDKTVQLANGTTLTGEAAIQYGKKPSALPISDNSKPLDASKLGNVTPTTIPTIPTALTTGNLSISNNSTTAQVKTDSSVPDPVVNQEKAGLKSYLSGILGNISGQAEEENKIRKEAQIAEKKQRALSISNEFDVLDKGFRDEVKQIRQNVEGKFGGAVEQDVAKAQDRYEDRRANISLSYKVANQDLQGAEEIVLQKVNAIKSQNAQSIQAYQLLADSVNNDLTESEKLQVQEQISIRREKAQTTEETYAETLKNAVQNKAPASVLSAIDEAARLPGATAASIATAAGSYGVEPLEKKYSYNDGVIFDPSTGTVMNPTSTNVGNVDPNTLAYAQQYASTGMIPTGLPKGTFGEVARVAKEMPKPVGTIVSNITGVKDSKTGVQIQDDFTRLYNITENVKKLEELDKKRIGGLVSGVFGKVLGSKNQAKYLSLRKAIVDDIQRMQSGAALTEPEQDFYEEYLPGRYSETFFLGVDSKEKIKIFSTIMNDKLKNGLSSNGLSIYGYSTVMVGEKEYRVGETIGEGDLKGVVLPDGQISVPNSTSDSVSSVSIPQSSRLSFVNNNPGNLRFVGQSGASQGQGGFAKFSTPESGADALKKQIALDASRGHTLSSFINKFAPPSENNTKQYIAQVSSELGISPNTKISDVDIIKLTKAIAKKESGSNIG